MITLGFASAISPSMVTLVRSKCDKNIKKYKRCCEDERGPKLLTSLVLRETNSLRSTWWQRCIQSALYYARSVNSYAFRWILWSVNVCLFFKSHSNTYDLIIKHLLTALLKGNTTVSCLIAPCSRLTKAGSEQASLVPHRGSAAQLCNYVTFKTVKPTLTCSAVFDVRKGRCITVFESELSSVFWNGPFNCHCCTLCG